MNVITINKQKTHLPANWNELTRRQMLGVTSLMQQGISTDEFRLKLLFLFTGWKMKALNNDGSYGKTNKPTSFYKIKSGKKWYIVTRLQLFTMSRSLDFLINETETKQGKVAHVNAKLNTNPIPVFRHGRCFQRYYGPSDRLYNLTFGEFITADNYFSRYVETNQDEFLTKLTATLYRRRDRKYNPDAPDTRGDKREPFNSHTVERRAQKLATLDQNIKLAIMLFFNGCKIHLAGIFTEVFSGSGKGKNKFGALGIITAMNNGDVTKSETIRKQYLYDVMVHLDATAKAHREYEARAAKAGKAGRAGT